VSEPRSAAHGPASASASQAEVGDTLERLRAIGAALAETHGLSVATDAVFCRHPFDGIMQKVASTRPDMVIKTTRHDTRLNRTFFNYTDWHLIRACPRPLLLVKRRMSGRRAASSPAWTRPMCTVTPRLWMT
jgi:hypothetical protein